MGLQFSSLFANPHNSQLTYLCSALVAPTRIELISNV